MSRLSPPCLCPQDQVFQFCCRDCCEDFKRLRGVVSQCEHCRQEKLLHEKLRFSGVEKSFCSEGRERAGRMAERQGLGCRPSVRGPGLSAQDAPPRPSSGSAREAIRESFGSHGHGDLCVSGLFPGCVLLYKQDFTKKLGLCCITCTYCSQTCQRGVTEQLDGSTWDFCSEDCKSKYLLWYCKVRRRARGPGRRGAWAIPRKGLQVARPPRGAAGLILGQSSRLVLGRQA